MKTPGITAEQFECHPAGANAVKESVLYCVGTAPDNYLVLGDIATWITAIAMVLLFIGAVLAWNTARGQLRSTYRLSRDQHRIVALGEFTDRLAEFCAEGNFETKAEINLAFNKMHTAATRWYLNYSNAAGQFDEMDGLIALMHNAKSVAQGHDDPSLLSPPTDPDIRKSVSGQAEEELGMIRLLLTDYAIDLHRSRITVFEFKANCRRMIRTLRDALRHSVPST